MSLGNYIRLDITFSVNLPASYSLGQIRRHLNEIKYVLTYFLKTNNIKLFY